MFSEAIKRLENIKNEIKDIESSIITHFTEDEFRSKEVGMPSLPKNGVSVLFLHKLEELRFVLNIAYPQKKRYILCTIAQGNRGGYRYGPYSNVHAPKGEMDNNRDAGGSKNSHHKVLYTLDGEIDMTNGYLTAGDFKFPGLTIAQVFPYAEEVFKNGGLGKAKTYLHLDYDGSNQRRRWVY